jgi:glycerol-3-phosphate dehydrogenase
MVPHTSDGRVMFAIPWHDHTVVGTTDTPIAEATLEPLPFETEVEFILTTAARYLEKAPTRSDVLSVFVGIRPLVRAGEAKNTAALSRDHTIHIDDSALLTVAGGKWTTYRHMAEDCVDQAATLGRLPERSCITKQLNIHGFHDNAEKFGDLSVYGSDAVKIMELARAEALSAKLHPDLPYTEAEVVWAVREEMARTVEDVLARRTRALFLNTRAAIASAPRVSELLAHELHLDEKWRARQIANFRELAAGYLIDGGPGEARTV